LDHQWRVQLSWIGTSFAVGIFGTLIFVFFGQVIASIALAREYRLGAPLIMALMGLAQTFAIMTHASDNAILSTGTSSLLLKTQIGLVVVTLLVIPLSTLWFGATGAAAGRTIAEMIKFSVTVNVARRLMRR
jgi:hypothetical protein